MAGGGTSLMIGPRETVSGASRGTPKVEQQPPSQQRAQHQHSEPQQRTLDDPPASLSSSSTTVPSASPVSLAVNLPVAVHRKEGSNEDGKEDTDLVLDNASMSLISTASLSSVASVPRHDEHFYHNQAILKSRENVLQRLSEALLRRSLTKIDLSQRGLQPSDARLVKMALLQNANLATLKLGYNNLGDLGVTLLASGIAVHKSLVSLDLGFNNFGDDGCRSLALALREAAKPTPFSRQDEHILSSQSHNCSTPTSALHGERGTLQTLYLAGNSIGEDGAIALADCIRQGCSLHKLYLTGNRIGSEGVRELTEAVVEVELYRRDSSGSDDTNASDDVENPANDTFKAKTSFWGMQELFLGGNGMESGSCRYVASLLEKSCNLRVISLPNCFLNDEDIMLLASGIKANRRSLPIESIQLSFNNMTHAGLEPLMNSLWESVTLRELKVDNNSIGDRGAHHIAAVLPCLVNLEALDVGFNTIKSIGLNALMKALAESRSLRTLSVSGNDIDVTSAKAVAYALAYNQSLKSILLVHCSILHEGQRHITAGAVSNNRTRLRKLIGFEIGPVVVTLGFPPALEHWTNEQVLNFIHLMWDKPKDEMESSELEREMDPLNFLSTPGETNFATPHKPLEASIVVEVAKNTYQTLVANGVDVFSRRRDNVLEPSFGSPLVGDSIVVESNRLESSGNGNEMTHDIFVSANIPARHENGLHLSTISGSHARSFVVAPEVGSSNRVSSDPARKKRIVEWLCSNIKHMNALARLPFNSRELWRLHQHYFSPVVNECGGIAPSAVNDRVISSVPEVTRANEVGSSISPLLSNSTDIAVSASDNSVAAAPGVTSLPLLKRKVSYRFLGDAMARSTAAFESNIQARAPSVARMIEDGHTGHSLPPKSKRARRNRTRISFVPRIKAKLDSYLDVCHEKALITMRQLYFVEQAILSGQVNPLDQGVPRRTHLSGILASEAETIIVDMT